MRAIQRENEGTEAIFFCFLFQVEMTCTVNHDVHDVVKWNICMVHIPRDLSISTENPTLIH